MSIKALTDFAVKIDTATALVVMPKPVFGKDEQKMNRDGMPLWVITCLCQRQGQPYSFDVTVASPDAPAINPGHPCQFDGLTLHFVAGKSADDWTGIYLTADSVREAK